MVKDRWPHEPVYYENSWSFSRQKRRLLQLNKSFSKFNVQEVNKNKLWINDCALLHLHRRPRIWKYEKENYRNYEGVQCLKNFDD